MSIADWFRGRRSRSDQPARGDEPRVLPQDEGLAINEETGEISRDDTPPPRAERRSIPRQDAGASTVQGERAIPSVNRERSVQSRVSNALALAAVLLLGGGALVWYYSTQFAKSREADEAAKKAAATRAAGEMKLPPLGRVEPPRPEAGASAPAAVAVAGSDLLGPAPLPPQASPANVGAPGTPAGPPPKTPAQLALERQLGMPVLLRTQYTQAAPAAAAQQPQPAASPPDIASLLGLQRGQAGDAAAGGGFSSMLKPTPTPAVAAQVVPTRRFLLPKGAFIDCTLETAIDSTYDGMTTCIGANDIYSADGKVVLLERGTKYVGEKRGEIKLGQARVFVLWNEARTPTGVVVNLASPGTDELGRAGLPGYVDTHFWDRFGAAILISVIDGTLQAIAASQQNGSGGGTAIVLNPQGTRDIMTEVLRSTVAIPPTVVKNQGERIQVLVARDVDFRPVYALRTENTGQ